MNRFLLVFSLATILMSCSTKPKVDDAGAGAPAITLKLISSAGKTLVLDLEQMKRELTLKTVPIAANPAYKGAAKTYEGFDLMEVLQKVEPKLGRLFWLQITTLDGWKAPPYASELLRNGNALLAIREIKDTLTEPISEDGLWSMVVKPNKTLSPGPFYIVWNDKRKNPDVMPLQVASIKINR